MMPPSNLAAALEAHELVVFPTCPFELPNERDRELLYEQHVARGGHKNISYDPLHDRLTGYQHTMNDPGPRLREILAQFSTHATTWLQQQLPEYARTWEIDRASFRPEEEAIRPLRFTARNDLLHIDHFPTRPARGRCLLRMFVNLNPTEPRVWVTSEIFRELLRRYAEPLRIGGRNAEEWCRSNTGWLRLWDSHRNERTQYDIVMMRLHHLMKSDEAFQDRARRRVWSLPPGSMWLLFADGLSHGVLRGQFALEHSYFIPAQSLHQPDNAPLNQLAACNQGIRIAG